MKRATILALFQQVLGYCNLLSPIYRLIAAQNELLVKFCICAYKYLRFLASLYLNRPLKRTNAVCNHEIFDLWFLP